MDLDPDLALVQECTEASLKLLSPGYESVFVKSHTSKGMALIYRKGFYRVRALGERIADIVAAFEIVGPTPFVLVAVWACPPKKCRSANYIREVHKAPDLRPEWFAGNTIIAGDWNSHSCWDGTRTELTHTHAVTRLRQLGFDSAYHLATREQHGRESQQTYSHRYSLDPSFHIDYVFLNTALSRRMSSFLVGDRVSWLHLSDHVPLTLNLR